MAHSSRNDPYKNFNFRVEISGVAIAGFAECSGLRIEVDVIEYREGGDPSPVRKLPGLSKVGDITLKRGITASRELYDWINAIASGCCTHLRSRPYGSHSTFISSIDILRRATSASRFARSERRFSLSA